MQMLPSILICAVTCVVMIVSVLFFPKIRLGKLEIDTYWIVTLVGAIVLLASLQVDAPTLGKKLIANTAVNPLKILVLFLSMTILSIFLDELGFFRFLASATLRRAKTGQKKLFLYLYLIVSVLTVFTSNDIIILSFTPFICYFAKNAKIEPTPYLAAEFVAANTWSLALIIGNPTNIYLTQAAGIAFVPYLRYSLLPTLFAGIVAFGALYLMFRKKLATPIEGEAEPVVIEDKLLLWVGIAHLAVCTLLLAIGSYIDLEMWIVSACAVASLFLFVLVIALVRRQKPAALLGCLKRAPYQLVPFLLSMFVLVESLDQNGVTAALAGLLGGGEGPLTVLKYGLSSFLAANLVNNIPMSVLFTSVVEQLSTASTAAVFATVIGSNIGAFLTPIGALAGIMWSSILNRHGLKFGFADFLRIGVCVALPALLAALGGLMLVLLW